MKTFADVLGFVVFVFLLSTVITAKAIPCDTRLEGEGLTRSVACRNGAPGDSTLGDGLDFAFDLNAGNYFGYNDWSFLQLRNPSSPADDNTAVDAGLNITTLGNTVRGSWMLSESIWEDYENLAVILIADVTSEDNVYWSSYLLQDGFSDGTWFAARPLSSFSVFGRTSQVSIPEPQTWTLLLAGLGGMAGLRRLQLGDQKLSLTSLSVI